MMKRSNLIYVTFNLFISIIIFDIFFRGLYPNIGNFLNIIKVIVPLLLICLTLFYEKKFCKLEKITFIFFIIFYLIFFIKIATLYDIQEFYSWLQKNNNINFIYVFIFYLSMRKLDMNVYLSRNFLGFLNFIVLVISFYGFITGKYFGVVNQDTIQNYAWVGTNKSRMMAIFGNPNQAGLYFVLMLFILDYFTIKEKKRFFNLSNLILCVANILTFSRTSIGIMIIYFMMRNKIMNVNNEESLVLKFLKRFRLVIILLILVITSSIIISNYNVYFFSLKYLFTNSRFAKWGIGADYALKNFIIGTQFDVQMIDYTEIYGLMFFSDNFFIELGAQFGMIIFIFAILLVISKLVISIKEKDFLSFNKIQLFTISSLLSGTIHFSVPMFLFIIYLLLDSKNLVQID